MIEMRSLLKEDELDFTDNPLKKVLKPGQSIDIKMDMSRGSFPNDLFLINKDVDIAVKEKFDNLVAQRLSDMHKNILNDVKWGYKFDPENYKDAGEFLDVQKIGDKIYFITTGDKSGNFIIGYDRDIVNELKNYVKLDNNKYEIVDYNGLTDYLNELLDIGGEFVDTDYDENFWVKKAYEFHTKTFGRFT